MRVLPRWTRSVRFRTALSATLVVAVVLAVAAVVLVLVQRQQLVAGLASVATQQGQEVVEQLTEDGGDAVDLAEVSASAGAPALVQVVSPDGQVTDASADVVAGRPLWAAPPGAGETVRRVVGALPGEQDVPYVLVATGVAVPGGVATVATGQSLEDVEDSTTVLVTLLATGYPVVLAVVGMTAYWLAGRALAPVEAIRRRVADISAADHAARVPVPPSGDEVARLAATMNEMLGRLQGAALAQRRFVADASHELRSPLTTIRANAELASSAGGLLAWPEVASSVLAETDRLDRLVADLLLLARADEQGLRLRTTDVDLDDVVAGEAGRLRRVADVRVLSRTRPVRVSADASHLARALRNLTDNAVRHAATTVRVDLDATQDAARIRVVDDGPGIPEDERERVFDRFVRLDDSRERGTGGSGLGLAIVRQIAAAHGGDVVVEAADPVSGTGAKVTLTLPLLPPGSPRAAPPTPARRPGRQPETPPDDP